MMTLLVCAALAAQERPLHEFHVDQNGLNAATAKGVRITLDARARIPEVARRHQLAVEKGQLLVRFPPVLPLDAPVPAHTAPSFLIDFDEPPVVALVAAIRGAQGDRPVLAALVTAVDAHVSHKSGARGMDVASVVARRKEGDCTEHAVLMAAVARAFGRPARVVVGLVAMADRKGVMGVFGHAWAEVHDDGKWQIADAALREARAVPVYLPFTVIQHEGMSFRAALLDQSDVTEVRALALVP